VPTTISNADVVVGPIAAAGGNVQVGDFQLGSGGGIEKKL
jgi:hypothetical protein